LPGGYHDLLDQSQVWGTTQCRRLWWLQEAADNRAMPTTEATLLVTHPQQTSLQMAQPPTASVSHNNSGRQLIAMIEYWYAGWV
jgi:hypothetical protein